MTTLDKDRGRDKNPKVLDLSPKAQVTVKGGAIKGGQVVPGTAFKAILSDNQNCGGCG